MNNFKILLTAGISFFVSYLITIGWVDKMVHFPDPINELGCLTISLTMGIVSLIALDYKGLYKWLISK